MAKSNTVRATVSSITAKADAAAKVDATVLAIPETKDGTAAKAAAFKAIDAVYNGYYRKGGIADLSEQIANETAKLSEFVYGIAVQAVKLGGNNLPLATQYFGLLCREAELHLKKAHTDKDGKAPTIEALLPPWQAYKSQVKSGMTAGLNPAEFATQGAFRAAAKTKKDAGREPGGAVAGAASVPQSGGLNAVCKLQCDALRSVCLKLSDEGQTVAAELIAACVAQVAALLKTNEGEAVETEEAVG